MCSSKNAALKKRLKQVEAGRDEFRRVVHAWAKASISAAQLRQWDREEDDSGQTILDVIAQFESSR